MLAAVVGSNAIFVLAILTALCANNAGNAMPPAFSKLPQAPTDPRYQPKRRRYAHATLRNRALLSSRLVVLVLTAIIFLLPTSQPPQDTILLLEFLDLALQRLLALTLYLERLPCVVCDSA
jgi:hypothetical protein